MEENSNITLNLVLKKQGLSNRECEVAEIVAKGYSNQEVADALFVCDKTVKFHLVNIYKKMKIKSRAQLIVLVFASYIIRKELK